VTDKFFKILLLLLTLGAIALMGLTVHEGKDPMDTLKPIAGLYALIFAWRVPYGKSLQASTLALAVPATGNLPPPTVGEPCPHCGTEVQNALRPIHRSEEITAPRPVVPSQAPPAQALPGVASRLKDLLLLVMLLGVAACAGPFRDIADEAEAYHNGAFGMIRFAEGENPNAVKALTTVLKDIVRIEDLQTERFTIEQLAIAKPIVCDNATDKAAKAAQRAQKAKVAGALTPDIETAATDALANMLRTCKLAGVRPKYIKTVGAPAPTDMAAPAPEPAPAQPDLRPAQPAPEPDLSHPSSPADGGADAGPVRG